MNIDEVLAGHELNTLIQQVFQIDDSTCIDETSGEPVMPNYSTDMTWAWSLVERIKKDKHAFGHFVDTIHELCNTQNRFSDIAVTIIFQSLTPLMICKAVIKAMAVE